MELLIVWDKLFGSKKDPSNKVDENKDSSTGSEGVVDTLRIVSKTETFTHWSLNCVSGFTVEECLREPNVIVFDA